MSFVTTTHVLSSQLADSGTTTINYPDGYDRGDFVEAYDHRAVIGQQEYKAPNDFTLTLNAGDITFTWKGGTTLASGTEITLQIDRTGPDELAVFDGTVIPNTKEMSVLHINLGSPAAADADAIVTSTTPGSGGEIAKTSDPYEMDYPRNVSVTATGDESGRTFTITGEDVYGNTVVEEISGPNATTANGAKAFAKVTKVEVDAATAGSITVGTGTVLGLPVFIGTTDWDIQRYEDGSAVATGTLTAADTATPTATTGDVRGTWDPGTAPDGSTGYSLVVIHPNPGYLGPEQYAG